MQLMLRSYFIEIFIYICGIMRSHFVFTNFFSEFAVYLLLHFNLKKKKKTFIKTTKQSLH